MIHDSASQEPTSKARLKAGQWAILFVVLGADVLDLMDSTICNIAAPSIVRDIGGDQSLIKWLGAGYALAMGALLVLGGRLEDRFGKRRIFLIGLARVHLGLTVVWTLGQSVDDYHRSDSPGWLWCPLAPTGP